MLDFSLISATPYNNITAFRDLAGILELAHHAIAATIQRDTATAVPVYPLGRGLPGDPTWLAALQQQHNAESLALAISLPVDFSNFNLRDEAEFYSFTFLLGNDLERIKAAAGL